MTPLYSLPLLVESRTSQASGRRQATALFALLQPPDGADRLTPQALVAAAECAGIEDLTLQEATDMIALFDDSGDGTSKTVKII